jgi:UDP-2-acetamido-2-deoxy-ribo-hexuluronate aminotransferase
MGLLNETPREAPLQSDIPFFDGSASFQRAWPRLKAALEQVITEGKYSHGLTVERLEAAVREWTGARHAVAVGSGTDALILLLRAASIGAGDEVVVPAFTFVATASSVANVGARPVFVDIEPDTYCLDAEKALRAVTARTRAIMPVHLFSQVAELAPLLATGGQVLEDSAEAIGMSYDGRHAGLLGTGGVLSFFPTKTLGALGDAGMVLTADDDLAEQVAVSRHHGRTGRTVGHMPGISHEAVFCGTNSKMDEIQAAVLLSRLADLASQIERRAELARAYDDALQELAPHVRTPRVVRRKRPSRSVYYAYVVEVDHKPALMRHLARLGIGCEDYYPLPLHLQPCFAPLGGRPGDCPVAERACRHTLALPFHPDLSLDTIIRVAQALASFYAD